MRAAKFNPLDSKFELCIGLGTHHVKILSNENQYISLSKIPSKIDDHGKRLKDNGLQDVFSPQCLRSVYLRSW